MNALRQALLAGKRRPRRYGEGSPLQFRGDGYEFVELREYIPGDDVRRIDWAASARSTQLQTRVMLEDVALTLAVWVDGSASMHAGRARSLLEGAVEIRDAWLCAAIPGDRRRPLESLEETMALPRGSALLLVSDFWDLHDETLELGYRHDCTALIARDPWQDDLPLSGFARVGDAESGDSALLYFGAKERARYRHASRAREEQLLDRFTQHGWRAGVYTEEEPTAGLRRTFDLPVS